MIGSECVALFPANFGKVALLSKLSKTSRMLHVLWTCRPHGARNWYSERVYVGYGGRPKSGAANMVVYLLPRDRHEL